METKFETMSKMITKIFAMTEKLGKQQKSSYYEWVLVVGDDEDEDEYEVQIGAGWFKINGKEFQVPFLLQKMSRAERSYKKSLARQQVWQRVKGW